MRNSLYFIKKSHQRNLGSKSEGESFYAFIGERHWWICIITIEFVTIGNKFAYYIGFVCFRWTILMLNSDLNFFLMSWYILNFSSACWSMNSDISFSFSSWSFSNYWRDSSRIERTSGSIWSDFISSFILDLN